MARKRHAMAVYLWQAIKWFDDGLQDSLHRSGAITTTRTQGLVIGNIALGETRPSRLARSIGVSPQAMSQILRDLEEVGLVTTIPDEADGRARVISLTTQGEKYLEMVLPIFFKMETKLEKRFGKPVVDVVRMVLEADWDSDPH